MDSDSLTGLQLRDLLLEENNLMLQVVAMEGEVLPQIEAALRASQFEMREKVDGFASVLERLELEIQHRKARAERDKLIQARCEHIRERIRESIKESMSQRMKKELKGYNIRFVLSPTLPRVELKPDKKMEEVPAQWKKVKVTESLDKEKIRKRQEQGDFPHDLFDVTPSFALREYANVKTRKELSDAGSL